VLAVVLPPIIEQLFEGHSIELAGGEVAAFCNFSPTLSEQIEGELHTALPRAFSYELTVFIQITDVGDTLSYVNASRSAH
jgi:hypothetical protein